MSTIEPRRGPGHFQWNAGGWFGSLIGCTCWMLLGAMFLGMKDGLVGWTWAGCFAVGMATGIGLWSARDRLLPYPAMQTLLLVLLACSFTAFLVADLRNLLVPLAQGAMQNPRFVYISLLVFPSMMLRFYFYERIAQQQKQASDKKEEGTSTASVS